MGRLVAFEWDEERARANLRRHSVDFADAAAVLEDEEALAMRDELTAVDQQRCLSLGRDARGRVLVVAHARRRCRVRLLVARRATAGERRQYLERGR